MSTSTLRITVIQDAPLPRDVARNLDRVREALATSDANLIVFPELFLTGYQTEHLHELALTIDDPRITALASACRDAETALLIGFIEAAEGGHFDAYLAIDADGHVLPAIRKTHLFGNERDVFLAGDTIAPITLCNARIGVINCFEIEFPEVGRSLALRGADLLIAGSANMHPYELDHRTAVTARALENRVPVAYANRIGNESGHHFCGSSRVVAPDGTTIAELDTETSGELTATLALGAGGDGATAMLAQRRPELYAA
ncbi:MULTISPECIES: nitrilase-related carbon-nitrogen hydrolase [unclassified Leucobacter]|uniref:nitrilase-related carbon-nitrogen hydrolase n=1 Tax=unclassified Leucobacter TaxID=2621730 RepID=UPI0030172920